MNESHFSVHEIQKEYYVTIKFHMFPIKAKAIMSQSQLTFCEMYLNTLRFSSVLLDIGDN